MMQSRPYTTAVLAMSADGKIGDFTRSPARFVSRADKMHLETQIATADAVLFGAATLRAYGTTLTVSHPELLQYRKQSAKSPQPIHIVTSYSAQINPEIRFFKQPVPRWLLTTSAGSAFWKGRSEFEQILVFETTALKIDIYAALQYLATLDITRLTLLGGGELVASMLQLDLIDEFWLTICPLILGGATAPTPVAGSGFLSQFAPRLHLVEVYTVGEEVFLNYQMQRQAD